VGADSVPGKEGRARARSDSPLPRAKGNRKAKQAQELLGGAGTATHTEKRAALDVIRREQFWAEAAELTPHLVAEVGALRLVVSTQDEVAGRKLFVSGSRVEIGALDEAVAQLRRSRRRGAPWQPGDILDVGANIGSTTFPALAKHFERAVAVEPHPENCLLLRLNALLNGMEKRLVVVEAAVSGTPGRAPLFLSRRGSGGHTLLPDETMAHIEWNDPVDVRVETIESLVNEGLVDPDRLGLVWMDAQGSEPGILQSAAPILERRVPIVVEVMTRRDLGWLESLAETYTHVAPLRRPREPAPARLAVGLAEKAGKRGAPAADLLFF